jgi:hypothetical protein
LRFVYSFFISFFSLFLLPDRPAVFSGKHLTSPLSRTRRNRASLTKPSPAPFTMFTHLWPGLGGMGHPRAFVTEQTLLQGGLLSFLFPYLFGFSFLCHFSFAGFLWVKDKTDAAMHPARPRSETVTQFPQSLSFFLSFLLTIFFFFLQLSLHPIIS